MKGQTSPMSDSVWYSRGRNKGNERRITLASATLLVGKAPTKQKRIRMKIRQLLDEKRVSGTPDWIAKAYTFVAQNHDPVFPTIEFKGFDIFFDDEQLFEKGASASKAQMRSFSIEEAGDAENPDIMLNYTIYAPFTDRLWRWCGQMGGEDFWARFEQMEIEEPEEETDQMELDADDQDEDITEAANA